MMARQLRNRVTQSLLGLTAVLSFILSVSVQGAELYFVDAHSQVDQNIELNEIISLMQKAGISKTILAARGERKSRTVAELAESYPKQIVAAVRTKSKHYKSNTPQYYKKLSKQVNSGRFGAMAELLLYHAQKGDRAEEVSIFPDDERVQAALKHAKSQGWPLILHFEFASLSKNKRENYFSALEALLNQQPDIQVVLIHMGQLGVADVEKLIKNHKNIYFLTSHCNPIAISRSNQPWSNLFDGEQLAPLWKTLIVENPNRFIFALDNVWAEHWRNGYKEQVQLWRKALSGLPLDVAHSVAHKNAERLWKLNLH